jgi:hypothetical protein
MDGTVSADWRKRCDSVNFWTELAGRYTDAKQGAVSQFGMLTVGAETLVNERLLIGIRASFDFTDTDMSNSSEAESDIEGTGWLAGPYISMEVLKKVYLDAFVGYGTSWNNYTGNYEGFPLEGDFEAERILARVALTGERQISDSTLLLPSLAATYAKEWSEDFKVSNSELGDTEIDSQQYELGRLTARVEADYNTTDWEGRPMVFFLAPHVSWNFLIGEGVEDQSLAPGDAVYGGIEGGLRYRVSDDMGLMLSAGYDGIGAEDWNAYNGRVMLNYSW